MTRYIPALLAAAFILGCSVIAASAQQTPSTSQPPAQNSTTIPMGASMMDPGMIGRSIMGRHIMDRSVTIGFGSGRGRMMGSPLFMRMMFALMDTDADGTVSLQEFQAAHERILKAMDANKDGVLTLEEIQAFMRGTTPVTQPSTTAPQQLP